MSITADSIRIVPLTADHLRQYMDEILAIEQEAYPDPWTQRMFLHEHGSSVSHFFLAFHEDTLIGYAGFWLILDEAHITRVTVSAAWRGLGFGHELVRRLIRRACEVRAETIRLEVREGNLRARQLYEKEGFIREHIRKGYYARTGESAIVMVLKVPLCGDGGTPQMPE